MGNTRESTGMAADEKSETKRGDRRSKERWQDRALRVIRSVISRIRSWSQNFKNVTLLKIIQALTQYSQSKFHLRHK